MVVDEWRRRELYRRLGKALGPEAAEALMAHLPPLGWGDVATKQDLENLRLELRAEIHQVARSQLLAFTTIVTLVGALLNGATIALLKLT